MKIFLLEDDYSLNESIKEMLEAENFVVDSFYDGSVALENVCGEYFVYIFDVNTPNIDGISLLEYIKNINPKSNVIIISANINITQIKEAYQKGCDDYIKKPFNIEEIILKIKKIVENYNIIHLAENIQFSLLNKTLLVNSCEVNLTKYERDFLYLLLKNKGQIISHSQIEDFVYNKQDKSLDAVRSLVKRLRKKVPKNIIQMSIEEGYFIK